MRTLTLSALALVAAVAAPGLASAATAISTANVNLRAGPSTQYPVVNVVGNGSAVNVYGCLSNRSWCDVDYFGQRGWMSSNYLAYVRDGRRYTGAQVITSIRAPIITFSFGTYWDNHYRSRSFYPDRDRWERPDFRPQRPALRPIVRETHEIILRPGTRPVLREEARPDRRPEFQQDARPDRRPDVRPDRRSDRRPDVRQDARRINELVPPGKRKKDDRRK